MTQLALRAFPYLNATQAALVIFLIIFLGALLWINRRGSKEIYQRISQIPLMEDSIDEQP